MHKFHELADKQDPFTSEYRVVWSDGTTLWLRGHGQVVARTPNGEATAWSALWPMSPSARPQKIISNF